MIMTKTVSLETAKKLKEAGYPQSDSETHYYRNGVTGNFDLCRYDDDASVCEHFAAPDVNELLEALPWVKIYKCPDGKYYAWRPKEKPYRCGSADTPAEALAALWLELRKKKMI